MQRAQDVLGSDEAQLEALLAEMGREIGAPWRKEHRTAAAAGIAALADLGRKGGARR